MPLVPVRERESTTTTTVRTFVRTVYIYILKNVKKFLYQYIYIYYIYTSTYTRVDPVRAIHRVSVIIFSTLGISSMDRSGAEVRHRVGVCGVAAAALSLFSLSGMYTLCRLYCIVFCIVYREREIAFVDT